MGTVDTGGGGCVCPEHVLLKMLTTHLVLYQKDIVIMDMEAGIDILDVEPHQRSTRLSLSSNQVSSIQTFKRISKLAGDIGVKHVYAIGNKSKTGRH